MSEITEQNQDRLIIVIPAYNEEENIENVVAQWHPIVEKTGGDSRMFVINDGSTDRTQEELDQLTAEISDEAVCSDYQLMQEKCARMEELRVSMDETMEKMIALEEELG